MTNPKDWDARVDAIAAQGVPVPCDPEGIPVADFTQAEELALVVGAAYGQALAERDAARRTAVALEQELAECHRLLDQVVKDWPDTPWAHDSLNAERLVQAIQNLRAVDSPQTPDDDQGTQ